MPAKLYSHQMVWLTFSGAVLAVLLAYGGKVQALSEAQLLADPTIIDNYLDSKAVTGVLQVDGGTIQYQTLDKACNGSAIIVIPGWSEPYRKYNELVYDLAQHGFCLYIYDHRGQGLSSRSLADTQIGHIQSYGQYVADLARVFQQIVLPQRHRRVFILAHSMGGLIATLYLQLNPSAVDGLILSAPLFAVNTGRIPPPVAYRIAEALDFLGFGERFVFTHGPWRPKQFANNPLTHSQVRFAREQALLRENPNLRVSGVSNHWLVATMQATAQLRADLRQTNTAVLLFQAQMDSFTLPQAQNRFCGRLPSCEPVFITGAKHELLMETDTLRDKVLEKILAFINKVENTAPYPGT